MSKRLFVGNSRFVTSLVVAGSFAGCLFPEYGEMQRSEHPALGETAGMAGSAGNAGVGGFGTGGEVAVGGTSDGGDATSISGETAGGAGAPHAEMGGVETCGDGIVNRAINTKTGKPFEECDPGHGPSDLKPINTTDCDADCTLPGCGDGFVNAARGEQCDDGPRNGPYDAVYNSYGKCTDQCKIASYCGDAKPDDKFEACDKGQIETETCNMSQQAIDTYGRRSLPTDCQIAKCGDGYVNVAAREQCDVQNNAETAECNFSPNAAQNVPLPTDCQASRCGDSYVNKIAGEVCDKGQQNDGGKPLYGNANGCTAKCQTQAYCGDKKVDLDFGEECDLGAPADPTLANTYSTAHNVTEPAGYGHADACMTSCKRAHYCGDGNVDTQYEEQCDGTDGCDAYCKGRTCGDGKIDLGEECDDRKVTDFQSVENNKANTGACIMTGSDRAQCKVARCGDGFVQAGVEDCDEGVDPLTRRTKDSSTCNNDCRAARCGDGYVNKENGEICDDGERGSLKCTGNVLGDPEKSCKPTWCGDGVVTNAINPATGNPFEECDPGIDGAACDDDCTMRNCGDGFVNRKAYTSSSGVTIAAEECDEGDPAAPGANDSPHCDKDCTWSVCGDGHVNIKAGEECDKALGGNCSAECKVATCGDLKVVSLEACDDGNKHNGDGCSSDCRVEAGWTCPSVGGRCTPPASTTN